MLHLVAEEAQLTQARVPIPPSGGKLSKTIPEWITPEEYHELGYPVHDPRYRDQEFVRQQLELEMTDPRVNPNLLLSQDDAEFWNNAMRKPMNKTLLQSDQWWTNRRNIWMKQYQNVTDANRKRELLADLLEDCSTETRRLVTPVLRYRIVEQVLLNLLDQAREIGEPPSKFIDLIERPQAKRTLETMRNRIDQ